MDFVFFRVPCEPGYYSYGGLIECKFCPEGFFCPSATSGPILCPLGTYSGPFATNCTNCEAGYFCPDSPGEATPKLVAGCCCIFYDGSSAYFNIKCCLFFFYEKQNLNYITPYFLISFPFWCCCITYQANSNYLAWSTNFFGDFNVRGTGILGENSHVQAGMKYFSVLQRRRNKNVRREPGRPLTASTASPACRDTCT